MAIREIHAELSMLHGHLSRELPPVLSINSGDTVQFSIPDAAWGIEAYPAVGVNRKTIIPDDHELDSGHCLSGPVYVAGARPGMVLEVQIGPIRPSDWGWTWVGWPSYFSDRLGVAEGDPQLFRWSIDPDAMTATNEIGQTVTAAPFLGFMAVAPNAEGIFSTIEPYQGGGNLDCRDLTAGTSLYLPVEVEGALFSCGDGHARQGDGELCGTALECAIESAELTFVLHESMPFSTDDHYSPYRRMPRAKTSEGWMTFGLNQDLEEAMYIAAGEMFELLQAKHNIDRKTAAALASVAVDFRVTQSVNSTVGVHAVLPDGAIS